MAIQTIATLKSYFNTGDIPTEAQFIDVFDTLFAQSPLTTKGDIVTYSTLNARLAVGTNGQVLTADSAEATGLKWATPASGITINSTAITSGTAGRILFENASNQVSEAAGLTYASGLFTVLGTTQQAKFAYDASNHLGITIASNGSATYALTGTTPTNTFNQDVISLGAIKSGTGLFPNKNYSGMYISASSSTEMQFTVGSTLAFSAFASSTIFYNTLTARTTSTQLKLNYDNTNYASFTTGATGSLTIALTGTAPRTTFSQGVTMGGTLRLTPYTVATLPSGVVGDTAYVTDATAPTYLGALTGGGAVTCPVFYNGAAWVSA